MPLLMAAPCLRRESLVLDISSTIFEPIVLLVLVIDLRSRKTNTSGNHMSAIYYY